MEDKEEEDDEEGKERAAREIEDAPHNSEHRYTYKLSNIVIQEVKH